MSLCSVAISCFPAAKSGHLTVSTGVTTIAESTFTDCNKLTSVTIPEGVNEIPRNAFYRCIGLKKVTLPDSLTTIGSYAFAYCSSLEMIHIPDNVTSVHTMAFYKCTGLKGIEVGKDNRNYSSEDGILFNKSRTEILKYPPTREGEYTILNSVTTVSKGAFRNCQGLTSVTLGNKVSLLGMFAFENCGKLASITFEGIRPPEMPYDPEAFTGFQFSKVASNAKIYVKKEATGFKKQFSRLPVVIRDE